MKLGIDIGSTTIKCALLNDSLELIYSSYERHKCHINEKLVEVLQTIQEKFQLTEVAIAISGSGAMGLQSSYDIPFVQEVYATRCAAKQYLQDVDCIIELGGEDAKILFLTNGVETRMNGTCAGGTGAFIDQMAQLLNVSAEEMNDLAKGHQRIYPIASRCGVFAKSDVQPLINQGALKEDLAMSIYYAVANQTIGGLAQGRDIEGRVVYLGGPLTFCSELRTAFDKSLQISGICPENSLYYVSMGTALLAEECKDLSSMIEKIKNNNENVSFRSLEPLFESEEEYQVFVERHRKSSIKVTNEEKLGEVALGIDVGSTTIKFVLINTNKEIVYSSYQTNQGNSIDPVKRELEKIYEQDPNVHIISACVTGYGEEMIKHAFMVDYGVVETMAHLKAAKEFMYDVDFIIDIGGQDMKCFKIRQGSIDNLFLNEACSSGCGSFLQTFANALNYDIAEFSKLGLFAKHPVNLGSRCTVFMNSSVKQAQKDGASIADISAGLSMSVVKNALYKVIRATDPKDLGKHVVVQGGTFYNDAVLRAFEKELGIEVVRPNIAGLMGAYGCALYALEQRKEKSTVLTLEQLQNFKVDARTINCQGCTNHCLLTINDFSDSRRYISGNRCSRPIKNKEENLDMNIYQYKLKLLDSYTSKEGKRGKIGIPMVLNMYELYPFWFTFFTELGFEVVCKRQTSLSAYNKTQNTIPSDTVCFPAKLVHGSIYALVEEGITTIFYPCMSYNIPEKDTQNCYNCPVVAYYPEVIKANMKQVQDITMINDFVGIHNRQELPTKLHQMLTKYYSDITFKEVTVALEKAFQTYEEHLTKIRNKGQEIIECAQRDGKEVILLAGRPYHIDPLINHGIDKYLSSSGVYVISEDCVQCDYDTTKLKVLNQWSYHSRLYQAAHFVKDKDNIHLIQLVSFGCGIDAITTDEVREIIEGSNDIYTQIKIDEITNLGTVKIRIRSLLEAIKQKGASKHE
ncbi:MAG: 2-hydroxyglutaryl-CoA dehydratase [Erysipelotrichaceae bacterium]|nr:2-hydroxyglutaryl-CoA dehydratase [Erysipelotrichaceae bacterium]